MNANAFFILDLWKKEAMAKREVLLSHDTMEVKLDLYTTAEREGALGALKHSIGCGKEEDNYTYGVRGSFRKLEVD